MLATDRTGYALPTLCAAAFHETGHLFAMWIFECQPRSIRLVPASVSITGPFPRKKNGEVIIALSGPVFNMVIACSLIINYKLASSNISLQYGLINLMIGIFNLLPVKGFDGGTVVTAIIEKATGNRMKAESAIKIITAVFGFLILFIGAFLILNGSINLSIIIMGLYILICAFLR